ncbi:MAG: trypsin-like peptidase domain-containing protein [Bacteroidetes bacterium]|nr:trypsin-like peptidase domain-containing protein [Bacteroidota bacterium]MCL6098611.1 trypsin-like peptidase domain-containing protein [Bacteroidota bacterium]
MNRLKNIFHFITTALTLILITSNLSLGLSSSFCSTASINSGDTTKKQIANSEISDGRHNVITKTVAEVSPAVVGINVTQIQQYRDIFSMDPFYRYWFGDRVYNQQIKSLGSGAIISPDGYIITNDHVAGNAVEVNVTLTDGREVSAKIIGTDPVSDICLLKIDGKDLPYIKLGSSDDLMPGEWVIALGNPFGLFNVNDKPTVTVGVISATGMNLGMANDRYYVNMIQTDAAINSGNSGGPLVNAIGELIGMNTLIYTAQGSSGNVGVGFAIPVNKIKKVLDELKKKGKVDRDFWTGLNILTVTDQLAKTYNLKTSRGVIITQIAKNSPAQKAGLKVEDIITAINDYKINDENTMIGILQEFRTGDEITITYLRDNKEMTAKLKLEKNK